MYSYTKYHEIFGYIVEHVQQLYSLVGNMSYNLLYTLCFMFYNKVVYVCYSKPIFGDMESIIIMDILKLHKRFFLFLFKYKGLK